MNSSPYRNVKKMCHVNLWVSLWWVPCQRAPGLSSSLYQEPREASPKQVFTFCSMTDWDIDYRFSSGCAPRSWEDENLTRWAQLPTRIHVGAVEFDKRPRQDRNGVNNVTDCSWKRVNSHSSWPIPNMSLTCLAANEFTILVDHSKGPRLYHRGGLLPNAGF